MQVTLGKLHEATLQQIFEQVATHLIKQNRRSRRYDAGCAYRGPDGLMCAVGALISDEEYDQSFEEMQLPNVLNKLCKHDDPLFAKKFKLLSILMDIHDHVPTNLWKAQLVDLAQEWSLDSSFMTQITK